MRNKNLIFRLLKSKIKLILAYLLFYSGFISVYRFLFLRNKCIILTYHRILPKTKAVFLTQDGMYVEPDIFEAHAKFLANHHKYISLDAIVSNIKSNLPFSFNFHITFDDGWSDNHRFALPICSTFKIRPTIFIATGFIGSEKQFWPEKMIHLIKFAKSIRNPGILDEKVFNILLKLRQYQDIDEYLLNSLIELFKNYNVQKIESFLNANYEETTLFNSDNALLTQDQLDDLYQNGWQIGSHTVNHLILTTIIDACTVNHEIGSSHNWIKEHFQLENIPFCFPNGSSNTNLRNQISKIGYFCSFSGSKGHVTLKSDIFNLERISIHNDVSNSTPLFACRLYFPNFF